MYLKLSADAGPTTDCQLPVREIPEKTQPQLYRRVVAGRHLFLEGDQADYVYEVKSGMVRLARVLENGRRQIVAFGLPGDIVGFPENGLYHTDCDAITDAVVLAHRRSTLEGCELDPALHRRLTSAALQEICAMQDHFMMLSSKSASEKMAAFLITMADRVGTKGADGLTVDLPMFRVDIADFLGLTTETVCRAFTRFRREGLVRLETAQRVVIKDLDGLKACAEPE